MRADQKLIGPFFYLALCPLLFGGIDSLQGQGARVHIPLMTGGNLHSVQRLRFAKPGPVIAI